MDAAAGEIATLKCIPFCYIFELDSYDTYLLSFCHTSFGTPMEILEYGVPLTEPSAVVIVFADLTFCRLKCDTEKCLNVLNF